MAATAGAAGVVCEARWRQAWVCSCCGSEPCVPGCTQCRHVLSSGVCCNHMRLCWCMLFVLMDF